MTSKLTRRQAMATWLSQGLAAVPLSLAASRALAQEAGERAPGWMYGLKFKHGEDDLIGDLLHTERGNPHAESSIPHRHWYSHHHHIGSWGPPARTYPPLPGLADRSLEWKRERVVATAARFIGYGYQHHHIPDWNPPAGWKWKETCVGHNGKGFDCSNFTSFVYNQGFGIHMTSAVGGQSHVHSALTGHGHHVNIRTVELPEGYRERQETLRTGDLLYIRGRVEGPITHVVIWIGSVGQAPNDIPLILDSHGAGVEDEEGNHIPCGVHLRPFRQHSWYDRCASHAHRIFH